MKKIEIEECHQLLLQIAKSVDGICQRNAIPYYMLGGTMLGAVRHKGFIPWDDDFDIGIERKYYDLFLEKAEENLPSHLKLSTYQNSKGIFFGFAKIQDVRTVANEPTYIVSEEDRNGVNIDIFPLDSCSEKVKGYFVIRGLFRLQRLLFVNSSRPSFLSSLARSLSRFIFRFDKNFLLYKIDKYIKKYQEETGGYLISFWSIYGRKTLCHKSIYGDPVCYDFEGEKFLGLKKSDSYLKILFGDYMKLPPEEKRRVHCDNLYWK